MAIDVLSDIKAAEEEAQEIRRNAAQTAKDALKLAAQENAAMENEELAKARHNSLIKVDAGREAAKAELDAQQAQRLKDCETLKNNARQHLEQAADICLERILR